jgi:hypothetical protein
MSENQDNTNLSSELLETYSDQLGQHGSWLAKFGMQYVKKWEDLLKKNNAEAAICEALTEIFLLGKGIEVIPNDIGNGGPDFLCRKNNKQFYVEATCITIDAATRETNLPNCPQSKIIYYDTLTKKILSELCNKASQCSNLGCPCIVAIGTIHCRAGYSCFAKNNAMDILTGTPKITMDVDTKLGRLIGPAIQTTQLEDSAFVRCGKNDKGQMEYARNPISAVLLCPFSQVDPNVIGLLHPNPNYSFEPCLLPEVPFGSLTEEHKEGLFSVEWKKYNEDGNWEVVE